MRIDRQFLEKWASRGSKPEDLTDRLAPYLLGMELGPAHLKDLKRPGAAVVLLSNLGASGTRGCAALPDGFLFPVRWVQNSPDDNLLPAQLCNTAAQVRTALEIDDWGLHRLDSLHDFDFSGFDLDGGSGFLALAAGLLVAHQGGLPDPAVFATGAWNAASRALEPVEWGGKGIAIDGTGLVETIAFAPVGTTVSGVGQVRFLASKPGQSLREALQPILESLYTPPGPESPLDDWLGYLNQDHMLASPKRQNLFARHAAAGLAGEVTWLEADGTRAARPPAGGALAIALDRENFNLADLLCAAYQPSVVYLLGSEPLDDRSQCELRQRWPDATVTFSAATRRWDVHAKAIAAWLRTQQLDGKVCYCDISPGTKAHSWAIAAGARDASAQVYWADQSTLKRTAGGQLLFGKFKLQRIA